MESIASFIAGFALFLVGIKLFTANLNQITTARFRLFIARFTPNDWLAGLWGIILSLFTAGNTFLTPCVAGGLTKVNALSLRKASQIVIWSRVGACFYIFLAGFDIKIAILFTLGISGISFVSNTPKSLSTFAASIFNLGLVLFGIQLIKSSTSFFVDLPWFNTVMNYTQQYPIIMFFAGAIFLLSSQSLFGALVVAVSFLNSEIFTMSQALIFVFGLYFAEGILKIFYMAAFKDTFKQVIALFPIIYFLIFLIGVFLYLIENTFHIPLLQAFARLISSDPKIQLATINLTLHIITSIIMSYNIATIQKKFLYKIYKKTTTEGFIEPLEIPSQVLETPTTTLDLIEKDLIRLGIHFSDYMENIRSGKSLTNTMIHNTLHSMLQMNFEATHSIFSKLLSRNNYHPRISSLILTKLESHNAISSLEDGVYQFAIMIDKIRLNHTHDIVNRELMNFVEAMDTLLMSLIDILENPEERFNEKIILEITEQRDDIMKNIRNHYALDLGATERSNLIGLISFFEKNIWLINKISKLELEAVKTTVKTTTGRVASKHFSDHR